MPAEGHHRPRVAVRALPRLSSQTRSVPSPDDLYRPGDYSEALLRSLMRAQLAVTLSVLLPAAAVVATYPLLSALFPQVNYLSVLGLPLSVLILGFGIYPPLVGLAFFYARRARKVEADFTRLLEQD